MANRKEITCKRGRGLKKRKFDLTGVLAVRLLCIPRVKHSGTEEYNASCCPANTAAENNIFIPDVSIGGFLTRERFAARLQNSVFCENIHSPEDCGYSRAYGNWAVSFKYLFCRTIITNSLKLLFFCKRGINNFFCALYRNKLNTGFYVRRYLF